MSDTIYEMKSTKDNITKDYVTWNADSLNLTSQDNSPMEDTISNYDFINTDNTETTITDSKTYNSTAKNESLLFSDSLTLSDGTPV